MASPYTSAHPTRLTRLRARAGVNAIDYVTAVGSAPDLGWPGLLLRTIHEVAQGELAPGQVTVTGGSRVQGIRTLWVTRLDDVTRLPAVVPPPERRDPSKPATVPEAGAPPWPPFGMDEDQVRAVQDLHSDMQEVRPDGSRSVPLDWVLVVLDRPGDRSAYRLALGTGGAPPPGFDPLLSEIELRFAADPTGDDDARAPASAAPAPAGGEELDYLARDFASFRRLMFDRLALTAPADASDDPSELRTVLVEAVAYAADELAYFQDAVATEAYLGTARARSSVRRHARLLDYPMHEGCVARAFVTLTCSRPVNGADLLRGATFLTRLPTRGVVLATADAEAVTARAPEAFEAVAAPATLRPEHNEIALHTWGDEDCSLPAGATAATLVDPDGLALSAGDFLVIEQTDLDDVAAPDAHHVVRLVEVGPPRTDPLAPGLALRDVRWHERDAPARALRVSAGDAPVAVARGNVVLAEHGRTVREALTVTPWGRGLCAVLEQPHLCWSAPTAPDAAAADVLAPDPATAHPVISLTGEGERWSAAEEDLLGAPPYLPAFVVEPETGATARVRFGDGVFGRRPVALGDFHATYRVGEPAAGNVGAEAIAHLVRESVPSDVATAVDGVRNPLPALGGTPPESLDEVRAYAPHAFRVPRVAVTEADWAETAGRHPRVQRAVAVAGWTGSGHTVRVVADPVASVPSGEVEALCAELVQWLEPWRVAGVGLEVSPPAYAALDIVLGVVVAPDRARDLLRDGLRREFSTGLLPDGRRGFFHPDEFSFGDPVWLSRVVDRALAVPGVVLARVAAPGERDTPFGGTRFRRADSAAGTEVADGRIALGPLEIARCDSDPARPEHGRIGFVMVGGR